MILNFITTLAVSRMTAAPPQEVQGLIESIRYMRGAGGAMDLNPFFLLDS
jgi:cation/acetate symporter